MLGIGCRGGERGGGMLPVESAGVAEDMGVVEVVGVVVEIIV